MEQVRLEQLESAGIDVKDALSRFMGNANLLEKFLKKFPDDQNYKKLCEALEADDAEAALAASHTLKGVCGNLSMTELSGLLTEQVREFRVGEYSSAKELMPKITAAYERTVAAING